MLPPIRTPTLYVIACLGNPAARASVLPVAALPLAQRCCCCFVPLEHDGAHSAQRQDRIRV